MQQVKKDKSALPTDLIYQTKKGNITPLRKAFYLIIPPRYSKQGKLPIEYITFLYPLVLTRFEV